MPTSVASAIIALLGPTCTAGQANPILVTGSHQLAGVASLAVVGTSTLVAIRGENGNDIASFTPGRRTAVVARPRQIGDALDDSDIVASPERIAVLQSGGFGGYKGCCFTGVSSVLTAPLASPLKAPAAGCKIAPGLDEFVKQEPGIQAHYAVALDGDVLAYDSFGCLIVDDFASGLVRIIRLEAILDPVRNLQVQEEPTVLAIAGRLVAYRANLSGGEGPATIVVYDIDSAQVLYRVPVPAAEEDNRTSFALQSDGTLVVDESRDCSASISSPTEPSPRPLGVEACAVYGLTDNQLLFMAPGAGYDNFLAWSTLQSPSPHSIADMGVEGALQAADPRIGPSEVVYALSDCYRPRVYRTLLREPGTSPPPPVTCPVHGAGAATLTRKGLVVPIRCPLGCTGGDVSEVRVGTANQLRRRSGGTSVDLNNLPNVSTAPDKTAKLMIPGKDPESEDPEERRALLRQLTQLLRRHHHLYVRLDFYIPIPAEDGTGLFGSTPPLGLRTPSPHVLVPLRLSASATH